MLTLNYNRILPASPMESSKVALLGDRLDQVEGFSSELSNLCGKLNSGWVSMKETLSSLGEVLSHPPLFSEEEKWFEATCKKCGAMLTRVSVAFDELSSRLDQDVVQPLCERVNSEIGRLQSERMAYQTAADEHKQALVKFGRMSKKKETEKSKFEGDGDLYLATKKYYITAVEYYSSLNVFRYSHFSDFLDPILKLITLQADLWSNVKSCFDGLDRVLLLAKVQQRRLTVSSEGIKTIVARQCKKRLNEFSLLYAPDPSPRDPFHDFLPIDQTMSHKAGYLFIRSQKPSSKWDLMYMSTEKGKLVMYFDPEEPPEIVTPLSHSSVACTDVDDRRYVFEVTNGNKIVLLQALSDRECDEWMTTIRNQSKVTDCKVDSKVDTKKDTIVRERESIKMWISKELGSMKTGRARIPDRTFTARYLGSATMDVGGSRHASLVAALKKAMAQQVHGMTISEKMTIVVRADGIKCYDAVGKDFFTLPWKKLAYCGYVLENEKLLGFVFPSDDKNKDVCVMFEADQSGKAIWATCQKTIKLAHKKNEEKKRMSTIKGVSGSASTGGSPGGDFQSALKKSDSSHSLLSDISDDMN